MRHKEKTRNHKLLMNRGFMSFPSFPTIEKWKLIIASEWQLTHVKGCLSMNYLGIIKIKNLAINTNRLPSLIHLIE